MTLPSTSTQNQQQSQHFLLKWNNHRTNLINVFEHLLQHENLVDVTLAIEGKFLKAHKIVLSACSPYFQTMFVNQTPEDKHPILIFHDLKYAHMKTLLEFMYRGEISIDERDLSDVLKIAEALSIRGLSSFESDEEDSASGTDQPNSPSNTSTNTAPINTNVSNTSTNSSSNYHPNDYFTSSQSSSSNTINSSTSQSNSDNQLNEQYRGKLGNNCDLKNSATVNGNKAHVTAAAKGVKKDKIRRKLTTAKASSSPVSSSVAVDSGNSGLLNKVTINRSTIAAAPPPIDIPVKKKRGRKPLNKNKLLEEPGSTGPPAVPDLAVTTVSKLPKSKSQPGKLASPALSHPPQTTPISPSKPVRRRIPKRLSTSLDQQSQIKRERLSSDAKNQGDNNDQDDYSSSNNGLAGEMTPSSEPLSEMSVRGLDLFKYAAIEDGVYRCMECEKLHIPKTFKNKYSFQRHAFLYHEGNMRKVFPCPVCFREFSRPDKMKNHLRSIHEGGNSGGGGGGGKSTSSPATAEATNTSGSGLGSRMNEHCDF